MNYIATIGTFDGVHKGHQFLLDTLCQEAQQRDLTPLVVVIDRPNAQRLTTLDEQNALLEKYTPYTLHFTLSAIRNLTAEQFLTILHDQHHVDTLLMGYDTRFGSDQLDYNALSNLNYKIFNIKFKISNISSSKIRAALLDGDIEAANEMLGYPYALSGTVVHGNGIGHTIGFPTANIQPDSHKLIPKPGVYAAEGALVNIGTNPTIGNDHLTIEAHLIDYHGDDLYGQPLTLHLIRRLRDEQHFNSLAELQSQIAHDLAMVKER